MLSLSILVPVYNERDTIDLIVMTTHGRRGVSRMLLGKPSTSRILDVAIAATGCGPSTVITKDHAVSSWLFVRLVGALLDSPEHMRH